MPDDVLIRQLQAHAVTRAARVYNNANISVANNTITALTFNTERFDTDTIHSTSANTGRLTCVTAGLYQINGHIAFASNTTGIRYAAVRLNGSNQIGHQRTNAAGTGQSILTVTAHWQMVAGDYVELVAFQNSGGALNVEISADYSPEFSMVRLGP